MKVLGQTKTDLIGALLGTGYMRFSSPTGIDGLCKAKNLSRLDVLAVVANDPNKGQFRNFINQCKKEFNEIYIWEIFNPILNDILKKYGFKKTSEIDDGEILKGWGWVK